MVPKLRVSGARPKPVFLKFALTFFVLFLTIAVNLPVGMIARLGFDPDILKVVLVTWVLTGLIVHKQLAFIVLIVLLCIGANLPPEFAADIGVDPMVLLAALVALVVAPMIFRE